MDERSYTMSRIRKTDTKPELLVRKFLFQKGFRFRLYDTKLPGNPDIVLRKHRTVIFVNGCFWHAHDGCKYNKMPKTNVEYWIPKILRNKKRDEINEEAYKKIEWKMITIWECSLKKKMLDQTLNGLLLSLGA